MQMCRVYRGLNSLCHVFQYVLIFWLVVGESLDCHQLSNSLVSVTALALALV